MMPTAPTQFDKAQVFRDLHFMGEAFIAPNPWDAGSARLLTQEGFKALATTSAGLAFSRGRADNSISRDTLLTHLAELAAATRLPISADLENGFGDAPEAVAQTIRLAAATGIVGGSIEDSTGRPDAPLYSLAQGCDRIRAASEAARALPFPFVLTARAENYFIGKQDLGDTIARLQAYQEAGADVLFAPGITSHDDIATVVRSVDRPVNVLMGLPGMTLNAHELSQLGVRRISVGGSLARAAYSELLRAAVELRIHGTASYAQTAVSGRDLNRRFGTAD